MQTTSVRHVLIVRFIPSMTTAQFDQFIHAFRALGQKIEGILSFEYGENVSPEGLNQGMSHVISLTFSNVAARDAYLIHPAHLQFVDLLNELKIIESLIVVDYIPHP